MKNQFEVAKIEGSISPHGHINFIGARNTYFQNFEEAKEHIVLDKKERPHENWPHVIIEYEDNGNGKIIHMDYPNYCLVRIENKKNK